MSERIINDDSDAVMEQIVSAMQEKKAKQIVGLDLSNIPNAVTKYFVICHAPSKTQVDAIYDSVLENVKRNNGVKPFNKEGQENSEWILIDYVDVVAHIFLEGIRSFYRLEDLWADAKLMNYASDD
jgi:ribosome-associated protein